MAPVKKRTFVLLEVLIAFSLVSLCIVPLMSHPLKLLRAERRKLILMEKERLADWTFIEMKERFLKNEIPWERIPHREEHTGPFSLPDAKIRLPGLKEQTVKRTFSLYGKGEKISQTDTDYRQLYVTVSLDEEKYEFRLPVQKLAK